MNVYQRKLKMIINVVVSACDTALEFEGEGEERLRRDIFSKSKREPVVRARTLLAVAIYKYGFTIETVSRVLKVSRQAVSKMLITHEEYKKTFKAYELTCKSVRHQIEAFSKEDDAWLQRVAQGIEEEI